MTTVRGKILISGGSGLIGSALCPLLAANGYQITRLVRRRSSEEGGISWDAEKPLAPGSVSGFDAVIHLAGETIVGRWTKEKKTAIRNSRVLGTKNLAEAVSRAPQRPQVFISASAIGYYGDRGEEVLREGSPSGTGFLPEVCREWEAATKPAADAGIRTLQMRFGVVLSAAGGALAKMLTPFRLGLGGRIGNGRQWWSWVDLQDVVGAILYVIKNSSLCGPVNVVSPNPVTNAEFTKTLASVLSRPAIFPIPAFAARIAFGEMADELFMASQRVEPARLLASGYVFQQIDLEGCLRNILRT
ncbi:MAG TPA: TIGR01777 family oxidoreductase [Terriglobales bacterium]|nr:TIGR01777 family oxidoreductase [Terriglobales bacterium]